MSENHIYPRGIYLKSTGVQKNIIATSSKLQSASIELWRFLLVILIVSVVTILLTILLEYFMIAYFGDTNSIRWTVTTMPTF